MKELKNENSRKAVNHAKVPQIPLHPPEGVKKFKSPWNPPFSKGEMLKRKSACVDRKYLRTPLFRVRVPLFGKEGLGEICGVRSGLLQFFHSFPFSKGEFSRWPLNPSLEKRGRGDFLAE